MSAARFPVGIQVTVGDQVLHATLDNGPAGRAFAALLPLTVCLRDHAGTEKVSDLSARLPTAGSPPGTAAQAGDLAYYAPWATWRASTGRSGTRRVWSRSAAWTPASTSWPP